MDVVEQRLAQIEARLLKLEGSLPAVSARMKTLERNNPLEARLRLLEAAISSRPAQESLGAFMIIRTFFVWLISLVSLSSETVNGPIDLPVDDAGAAAAAIDLSAPRTIASAPNPPVADAPQGKPHFDFVLTQGLDGYSQSLALVDIEDCGQLGSGQRLSGRAKVRALHSEAVARGLDHYKDPSSGYDVFTSHHLKTRECCGSSCRHCPWGHRNVPGIQKKEGASLTLAAPELSRESGGSSNLAAEVASPSSAAPIAGVPQPGVTRDADRWRPVGAAPKSRLYTRKGDSGWGTLYNEVSILKSDPIYEAIGTVDELNSTVGLAAQLLSSSPSPLSASGSDATNMVSQAENELASQLETVQAWLLDVGSALCTPRTNTTDARKLARTRGVAHGDVVRLERWIDEHDARLSKLASFILPGGSPGAAALHVARTVCRRAERLTWPLLVKGHGDEVIGVFLNRLSDYLFVAARLEAASAGGAEHTYKI